MIGADAELTETEMVGILAAQGWTASRVLPYVGEQRHRTVRAWVDGGRSVWLKVEAVRSPVAGVAHEAIVLARLAGQAAIPTLLAQGIGPRGLPFLVTAHIDGSPLEDRSEASPEVLGALACLLMDFSKSLDRSGLRTCTGLDVFAARPPLRDLLAGQARRGGVDARTAALMTQLQGRVEPERVGLVHGSFDTGNVLVEPDGPLWLVDLEATRPGPVSLDVASMAGSIAEWSPEQAGKWIGAAARVLGADWNPVNVAGYLILRAAYRELAGVLTTSHRLAILDVVEDLLEPVSSCG